MFVKLVTPDFEEIEALDKPDTTCPHCGFEIELTDCDNAKYHVTYWAEDGPVEYNCEKCGQRFWIQEYVERYWISKKYRIEFLEI